MMAQAAKKYDRLLVEAVWTLWHPRFARIVELVSQGDIGQLSSINSSFTFTGSFGDNYRLNPLMGGGSLLDVGVYQAHTWSALCGNRPTLSIESVVRNVGATGVDLTTQITGTLSSGIKVGALTSFEKQEAQHLVITGSEATIECMGNDAFTSWKKPSSMRVGDHLEEFPAIDPYAVMIENFGCYIQGEPSWTPQIEDSLYVMGLLDQIKDFT
jgi:xylose dehydrogenase (NAD/NADP)